MKYICSNCGTTFNMLQPLKCCVWCGNQSLKKIDESEKKSNLSNVKEK